MKLKNVLAGALAGALAITAVSIPAETHIPELLCTGITAYAEAVKGDVDGSGALDLHDSIMVAEALIGSRKLTDEEAEIADVNGSGSFDFYDSFKMADLLVKSAETVTGNTPADGGGIVISDAEVDEGTATAEISLYISKEIKSKGMILKFNVPSGIELKNVDAFSSDGEKGLYISASGFAQDKPVAALSFGIPADTAPGEYKITADILALDDANGGYYANPTVTAGTITIKGDSEQEETQPATTEATTTETTTTTAVTTAAAAEEPEIIIVGDVDGSGSLDLHDSIMVAEALIGSRKLTKEEAEIADVNGSGSFDFYDSFKMADLLVKSAETVTGNTPADGGGIVISDAEVDEGTATAEISLYISKEIKSKGMILKFNVPSGIELKNVDAFSSDGEKGLYISASGFAQDKPVAALSFGIPADTAPGEYKITADILALDDANGGYYANPTVTAGTITIKDAGEQEETQPATTPSNETTITTTVIPVETETTTATEVTTTITAAEETETTTATEVTTTTTAAEETETTTATGVTTTTTAAEETETTTAAEVTTTTTVTEGTETTTAAEVTTTTTVTEGTETTTAAEVTTATTVTEGTETTTAAEVTTTTTVTEETETTAATEATTTTETTTTPATTDATTTTTTLPQTGNNKPNTFIITVSAIMLSLAGVFVMKKSKNTCKNK